MASAQSKWTLTTADFQSRQVDLQNIDDKGVTILEKADLPPRQIAWDSLLGLDRPLESKPQPARFVLSLVTGDLLGGDVAKIDGETLTFNATALGTMTIPLRQVTAIARSAQSLSSREAPTEDVVILSNGDSVHGIVSSLADKQLTVQVNGNATPVPLDSVATILFASTAKAPAAQARSFRVKMADGSLITAQSIATAGNNFAMKLAGGSAASTLDYIASIEQLNGPVSWLSSRPPAQNVQTPLLQIVRPAKMDHTVTGGPIRFGDRTYTRGIGVAPYSKITWPLDPAQGYQAFRAQYAIDGIAPYADVTVRILLDGKPVHERKTFTAGQMSPVIVVPLGSAKSLTLEVDFGANYNVQAHLNWIEPALVKSMPVIPTTRP